MIDYGMATFLPKDRRERFDYLGITIVPSPSCVRHVVEFKVVPWGTPPLTTSKHHPGQTRKKRRRWRVLRVEREEPVAYMLGDQSTLIAHTDITDQIRSMAMRGSVVKLENFL